MVEIEVSEDSDNQVYPIVVKQRGKTTAEDLTNYTAAVMTIISQDLKNKSWYHHFGIWYQGKR